MYRILYWKWKTMAVWVRNVCKCAGGHPLAGLAGGGLLTTAAQHEGKALHPLPLAWEKIKMKSFT